MYIYTYIYIYCVYIYTYVGDAIKAMITISWSHGQDPGLRRAPRQTPGGSAALATDPAASIALLNSGRGPKKAIYPI